MNLRISIALLGSFLLASFSACSRNSAPPSNPLNQSSPTNQPSLELSESAQNEERLSTLLISANTAFADGLTNQSLSLLSDALSDPSLAFAHRRIFSALLQTEISAGLFNNASNRMMSAYRKTPNLAEEACGIIYHSFLDQNNLPAAIEWTEEVLAIPSISDPIRRNMREWNFLSVIQSGNSDRIVSIASSFIRCAPACDAIRILRRGTDILIENRSYDVLSRILTEAGRSPTSDKSTTDFLSILRLRLASAQAAWDKYLLLLPQATASLSDSDFLYSLRRTLPAATKTRNPEVLNTACMLVLTNANFRPMTYEYAARQWVDAAATFQRHTIPSRLEWLTNQGRQIPEICSIFSQYAYDNVDDAKFVDEMKPIGERLILLAGNEDSRASVRTIVLDYCFILEDFSSALHILDAGIAGYDASWHEMAKAKVRAHKALQEDRPLDAIREFRAFMTLIRSSNDSESEEDPSTGVIHTRDMILGRNAKRIGDIYASIPNADQAATAFREARSYYESALKSTDDPDTIALIQKELALIPSQSPSK